MSGGGGADLRARHVDRGCRAAYDPGVLRAYGSPLVGVVAAVALAGCLLTIDESRIDGDGGGGVGAGAGGQGGAGADGGGASGGASSAGGAGGGEASGRARILYTDLEGGPSDGGEDGLGAFVTLYGLGFGASMGASYVTFGGGVAAGCPVWTDTRVTCQIGSSGRTGDVVVHVAGDGASNAVPFTVRPGAIYFVGPLGDDNGLGLTPETPFETVPHCLAELAPGGICYALDVVQQLDTDGAALVLPPSSQAAAPKALLAYPGSLPRIQSAGTRGVLACNDSLGCADDGRWVLGGLRIEAPARALDAPEIVGLRLVGSTVFCASSSEAGDCLSLTQGAREVSLLGNLVTVTQVPAAATPAAVHLGAGVSTVMVGWNTISGPAAWAGIRVDNGGGVEIVGNHVTDVGYRGIDLPWLDMSLGALRIENNVVAFAGDGTDMSACVAFGGTNTADKLLMEHNTLYDCGSPNGANIFDASPGVVATNNIVAQPDATLYYRKSGGFGGGLTGTFNLFSGSAAAPPLTTNNLSGDPAFAAAVLRDFHLLNGSAAIDAGASAGVALDRDGRPRDAAPDVGAYELP